MNWDFVGFDRYQIAEIERGYAEGINVDVYADSKYTHGQMHQIRLGLLEGNDITQYCDETFTYAQMREIRIAMQEQNDPSIIADHRYSSAQMAAISSGMIWGVDVEKYADPAIPFYAMLKIKEQLIADTVNLTAGRAEREVSPAAAREKPQPQPQPQQRKKSHEMER